VLVTDERVEITPYLDSIVRPTVADVHRRWGEHVPLDDLMSEAAVWWYGPGQTYLPAYLAEDLNHVRLRRSIWRWCARYAEAEKAQQVGYEPVDQVVYSTREVLALIPLAMDPEGIPGGGGVADDGPKAKPNLAESGDVVAALIDVRRALDSLAEDDRRFLQVAEDVHHDWERVVTYLGAEILPDTARRRHTRVVNRMTRYLNGNPEENAA
jgi:hypothetical protein